MATIKKPRGRMTKPLLTPYEVGDVVLLVSSLKAHERGFFRNPVTNEVRTCPRYGDIGVIERVWIDRVSADGKNPFLVFIVRWSDYGGTTRHIEPELAPMAKHAAWLQRQLNTLSAAGLSEEDRLRQRVDEIGGNGSLYIDDEKGDQQ